MHISEPTGSVVSDEKVVAVQPGVCCKVQVAFEEKLYYLMLVVE